MSDERKPVWEETYAVDLPEPRHDEYAEMIGVVFANCECREHEKCVAAWVQPEHTDQPNCEGDYERRQQRAQLLSAAPDMARALRNAEATLMLFADIGYRECARFGEVMSALDAALRKAGVR